MSERPVVVGEAPPSRYGKLWWSFGPALTAFGTILVVWWAAVRYGLVSGVLLPSPADVYATAVKLITSGRLPRDVGASLVRVVQGFLVAVLIALPLGVIMGISKSLQRFIDPVLEFVRPIPPIAMIPLAILWFGIGESSKVAVIAYGAFFPIVVNVMAGFRSVDLIHLRAIQTLGAGTWQTYRYVIIPSAFPQIVVGLRLGMSMAFIVLVAAELIASSKGLGFLIQDARYRFRTDEVFVGMFAIGLVGYGLNRLLLEIEKRIVKWRD